MVFSYADEIRAAFPTIVGGVLHVSGLHNGATPADLAQGYQSEQASAIDRIGSTPLAEIASIAAWRRAFSSFGVKPTQHRNAAEALLRRLTKQSELPSINLLVDLANLVSIRYALPVAVFDQAHVSGSTVVRFAHGDERFTDLGGDGSTTHPAEGEVVFVDDAGLVSARRWCWRQSAESAAGPTTTEAVITVEAHHDGGSDDVSAATADIADLLATFQQSATQARIEP